MKIGDVEIPIVSNVEHQEESEVDEIKDAFKHIDSTPVKYSSSVDTIFISGFLNEEKHSKSLSIAEQKSLLKSLRTISVVENTFKYRDFKGHLLVEEVSFSDNSDSRIINEVEITARFFPWPKYYPGDEP